jgi:hypothetical protein
MVGILSVGRLLGSRNTGSFSPATLFASGEQGVWYDPSDYSSMFQNSTGTTAVTGLEQPVGLLLDKSKAGVGTNGAKRVNLLTYTEQFDNAAWTKSNATVNANTSGTTDPLGGNTSDALFETVTNSNHQALQTVTVAASTAHSVSIYVKANGRTKGSIECYEASGSFNGFKLAFDLTAKTVTPSVVASGTCTASAIEELANGWFKITGTGTFSTATSIVVGPRIVNDSGSESYAGDITKGIYVWGADLRLASEASTSPTPYQRITDTWSSTLPGNHASQATSASRPVLSARYNLVTYSEAFDNAAWTKADLTAVDGATDPNGGALADTLTASGANGTATQSVTAAAAAHVFSVWLRRKTGTGNVDITCHSGGTWVTQTITSSWARYSVTQTLTAGSRTPGVRIVTSGDEVEAFGADLRVTNDGVGIPAYQRIAAATDYDSTGFPAYLRFDGTDDSLATASINFTATDKMSVFAGVRKLSDAAIGLIAELSVNAAPNTGSFVVFAPSSASQADYFLGANNGVGIGIDTPNTFVAPITNIYTGLLDVAAPSAIIRINGVQSVSSTTSQGVSNYGNYALYIGSRAGTSLRFNGRLYSLIVRGAASTAGQISDTETWVNGKTKAYV